MSLGPASCQRVPARRRSNPAETLHQYLSPSDRLGTPPPATMGGRV